MAHCFIPSATASAMERSRRAPLSMTSMSFSYTSAGRYLYIFWRVKTYLPKYSDGLSFGVGTSIALFLKASSTTWNLKFSDISSFSFLLFEVCYFLSTDVFLFFTDFFWHG